MVVRVAVFSLLVGSLIVCNNASALVSVGETPGREVRSNVECSMVTCDGIGYGFSADKASASCAGTGLGSVGMCLELKATNGCWVAGTGPVQNVGTPDCDNSIPHDPICEAKCSQQAMICCEYLASF